MAKKDLGKVGISIEGEWKVDRYYERLSLVSYEGQAYISLRDTTGDAPADSHADWILIARRGESLYQMMVRIGAFSGTEEEFAAQYNGSIKAMADAVTEVHGALDEYERTMRGVAGTMNSYADAEAQRNTAEKARAEAEQKRVNDEATRARAEKLRLEADKERQNYDKAEEERAKAEAQRVGDEQRRKIAEEDRERRMAELERKVDALAEMITG